MEMKSPPPCPSSVTVRRNPPRRARPTPYSAAPPSQPPSSKTSSAIRSFPIEDILSINIPDKPEVSVSTEPSCSEKLKVFLRIRPIVTHKVGGSVKTGGQKNVWPQNPRKKDVSKVVGRKTVETCLKVNDEHSVTLCAPQSLTDVRRTKSEVYEGFSHVFCDESTQSEVYERMMNPLVEDFLKGKSGMLAAMGPSGSGKTHTVFGSTRQPGMVSLALRHIFSQKESGRSKSSRAFYLSMFEIYSERGKGEKIMDLSQEGGDLYMQQSNIKGLKEEVINDVQQAESLIASGMLKRSTAMTNSNIQSSRSQCIINIRCDLDNLDEDQSHTAILTIVDLAGAEREKRTGNQGARLLESNFINNTSMVFGLCLRSLLEHQKNPKKPLHKHFQNSMLTKYLRDFLEGKKRMALILTAKPGEEDYQDTSYLLRQASPFMNIKFESIEEQPLGNKRRTQTLPKAEQAKRMKLHSNEVCMDDEVKRSILHQPHKELIPEPDTVVENNSSSFEFPLIVNNKTNKDKSINRTITDLAKKARENQILSNFSRALWKVLKEYKNKLEASENENDVLRHSLTAEKERCTALEVELNLLKASCSCGKVPIAEENDEINSNAQVSSSHSIKMECTKNKPITTDTQDAASVPPLSDCSNIVDLENTVCNVDAQVSCSTHREETQDTSSVEVASTSLSSFKEHNNEENIVLCEYVVFDKEDLIELGDTEFSNDIAVYDPLESGVSDLELPLHGDGGPLITKGDQRKHEEEELVAEDSSSNLIESEGFPKGDQRKHEEEELLAEDSSSDFSESEAFQTLQDNVTIDHEITPVQVISKCSRLEHSEERSKEQNVEISSPAVVLDKQELQETEERVTDGEITESAVCDSELHVHGQHEEDVSIPDDLEKFEDHSNKKIEVSSPNIVCDKQDFKEVKKTNANGEVAVAEEVSTSPEEVQKEPHEKEVNVLISSSDLEGSKSISNTQLIDSTEAQDSHSVLPEEVISSRCCTDSKLLEVPSVHPSKPLTAVKPKRRLRPASSVMLKNINILEFDDSATMPKQHRHGKRDENEDGRKRTQGSNALLRILKQNLHH
ncbi:kinesin-like protein KIN-6 isoform X5 [Helianthus annuus]|uniref:kinesin-like protein KIN-6 isoform X5 n=1 Tax=Helianthus annuus TaxID=4232 RepID=UPI001653368D|nr:kinesin-like protein KIN-6 isoform X5 [Helianthus annuus]